MKIFISWSKEISKECAELLKEWIKCTLQLTSPWVSSKDIDKGSLWFNEINDQLKETKVGIVCLTKENKNNPWILFESGALAKGLKVNKVCTFLVDLQPSDIESPLAQFNHTLPTKEGMKSLLSTINKELGDLALDEIILEKVFNTYWPQFETDFSKILENTSESNDENPVRSKDDILKEILYTTRTLDKRIRNLENLRFDNDVITKNINVINDNSIESDFRYNFKLKPKYTIKDAMNIIEKFADKSRVMFKKANDGTFNIVVRDINVEKRDMIERLLTELSTEFMVSSFN